ncbi:hypothetical protein K0T92_15115 [Paenibacillus oenotherae]|uniref:Uncharacterized protein n=1 Tax=Paenibacillus oenotherae TaxID=1435645 RepID=A0ABS7D807_9BACL|nr:hypothetical protein [Paenibacillus oenotherae]MBW7476075.1 hypothetical protein [Paenibacillus oenotherae]
MIKKSFILAVLVLGLLLIAISVSPLFLVVREFVIDSKINSRYEFKGINNRNISEQGSQSLNHPIKWEGNVVEILTEDTGKAVSNLVINNQVKHKVFIKVVINGMEIYPTSEAWLAPNSIIEGRVLSWLNIVEIKDNVSNETYLAIIQRLSGDWLKGENITTHVESQKWRVISIHRNKELKEETFSYTERGDHLLGVKLIQLSSQSSSLIGYKSDLPYRNPSIYFPVVYPLSSCLIGLILLIVGFIIKYKVNNHSRL